MGNWNSGRRPQPTAIKLLRGNPGKRAVNPNEPIPPAGAVLKPKTLSKAAARVWNRLAPIATAMKTLTRADVTTFATLCELQATLELAARKKNRPKTFEAAWTVERFIAPIVRQYYAVFGFEPMSRAKIRLPKADESPVESKWAGVLT